MLIQVELELSDMRLKGKSETGFQKSPPPACLSVLGVGKMMNSSSLSAVTVTIEMV